MLRKMMVGDVGYIAVIIHWLEVTEVQSLQLPNQSDIALVLLIMAIPAMPHPVTGTMFEASEAQYSLAYMSII